MALVAVMLSEFAVSLSQPVPAAPVQSLISQANFEPTARVAVLMMVRLPKRLEPCLVMLRDPKIPALGENELRELADRITDRNYRLFAERGQLHVINGSMPLHGTDPFELFAEVERRDAKMDPAHAFYPGYELAKAATALTLGKAYQQDQELRWGLADRDID